MFIHHIAQLLFTPQEEMLLDLRALFYIKQLLWSLYQATATSGCVESFGDASAGGRESQGEMARSYMAVYNMTCFRSDLLPPHTHSPCHLQRTILLSLAMCPPAALKACSYPPLIGSQSLITRARTHTGAHTHTHTPH